MAFVKLFETCRLGSLELKNRMIMPPCSTNMGKDGFVTERMKEERFSNSGRKIRVR